MPKLPEKSAKKLKIFFAGAARTRRAAALDPFGGLALRARPPHTMIYVCGHTGIWLTQNLTKKVRTPAGWP